MPTIENPSLPTGASQGRAYPVLVLASLVLVVLSAYQLLSTNRAGSPPNSAALHAQYATAAIRHSPNAPAQSQFGWLSFISKPLYAALRFTHKHVLHNWGWAIAGLTVAFNLLLLWPRILALRSSLKMARLQPKINAVRNRYANLRFDDPKRSAMTAEIMEVYKAEGTSMYGGCVPMLLQMPLFFGFMRVLQAAGELHHANWLWIADLAAPDPLHILPFLIIAAMVLTQWLTPAPAADAVQRRLMLLLPPLFMGFTLWHCASGLALYWLTGNLFGLVLQLVLNPSSLGRQTRV